MKAAQHRRLAVLGTVVVVLGIAGGAAVLGRDGHQGPPSLLRLAPSAVPRADAALATGTTPGGDYQLVGTLPAGTPADTPVHPMSAAVTATTVGRLADALGAGTPVRDGDTWRAKGLQVGADGSWWWSLCADATVSSDGLQAPCATVATSGGSAGSGVATGAPGSAGGGTAAGTATPDTTAPLPPDSPPAVATAKPVPGTTTAPRPVPVTPSPVPTADADTVLSTAGPVFDAVGLDVGDARVDGSSAVVDPVVGGLPTYGVGTRVDVAADGTVTSASGWLTTTRRGDSYPLLSAKAAFDALPPMPRMMLCPIGPDGKGCLPPEPVRITGARLGLALRSLADGHPVLVPSWLFQVKGSTEPVVGVAVEPRYLDDGSNPSPGPTTSDRPVPPVGSGTAAPPEPGTGGATEPAPTEPSPAAS
jgi:hypothetical protein